MVIRGFVVGIGLCALKGASPWSLVHHLPDVKNYLFIRLSDYLFAFLSSGISVTGHANSKAVWHGASTATNRRKKGPHSNDPKNYSNDGLHGPCGPYPATLVECNGINDLYRFSG
jgi:hypothetical protein